MGSEKVRGGKVIFGLPFPPQWSLQSDLAYTTTISMHAPGSITQIYWKIYGLTRSTHYVICTDTRGVHLDHRDLASPNVSAR